MTTGRINQVTTFQMSNPEGLDMRPILVANATFSVGSSLSKLKIQL